MRPTLAEASRNLLRDRVLDAVSELLAGEAWRDVTMAEVAEHAGVSRQTLYNAFGSREELAQAYLMREAERFLASVEEVVRSNIAHPHRALRAALELFLGEIRTHPMLRAAVRDDGDDLVALATTRGAPLLLATTDRLAALLVECWPIDPDDARLLAETLVRLAISHAALPSGSADRTAADVSRVLDPFVDVLLRG